MRPSRFLCPLAAGLALALAGCGGDDEPAAEPEAQALGDVRVGSVAQLAQCRDWVEGDFDAQMATVAEIKEQINLEDSNVRTPELSDEAAYEVLDSTCANDYAVGFRLYKVYARATAFASFAE